LQNTFKNQVHIQNSVNWRIPAVLKLSWNNILDSYSKEEDIKPLINIDENKINVEILAVKEIEEIILEEEIIIPIKNEEIKVITDKLVKNKKEIISKIEKTLIENKKPVENLLSASVGTSVQNQNTFFYAINLILEKISSSFSWLFINLIF